MQQKDCVLIGIVSKSHGYKGNVKIINDNNIVLNFNNIKYFLIEKKGLLVPFFISEVKKTQKNIILVKFEDINSEKEVSSILKEAVYLPKDLVPENGKDITREQHLLGFKILDTKLGELGKVNYIDKQTSQKLIYVKGKVKDFCFPMHEKFILNINQKDKKIEVSIPEELINLN